VAKKNWHIFVHLITSSNIDEQRVVIIQQCSIRGKSVGSTTWAKWRRQRQQCMLRCRWSWMFASTIGDEGTSWGRCSHRRTPVWLWEGRQWPSTHWPRFCQRRDTDAQLPPRTPTSTHRQEQPVRFNVL